MQPTFLPWVGYFDLIDRVDRFVFLDTVPLARQSWQHRNRIKTAHGMQWLTLPVDTRASEQGLIADVVLGPVRREKIRRAIEQSYARAAFFKTFWPRFSSLIDEIAPGANLAALNIALIAEACAVLGITTPLFRASQLPPMDGRIERLIAIVRALGGTTYVSPQGAAAYLAEVPGAFAAAGITLSFQSYRHPSYRQLFPPFLAGCGIIDLLMNEGPASAAVMRSGRCPEDPAESVFAAVAAAADRAEQAA